ncbi:MAG: hypothetical protein M9929_03885 [Burkholderiaceae bacterium]|nr:hypothetical protein [Burkholderiaceae bacterium]
MARDFSAARISATRAVRMPARSCTHWPRLAWACCTMSVILSGVSTWSSSSDSIHSSNSSARTRLKPQAFFPDREFLQP